MWTLSVVLVKRDCRAIVEGDFYRVFVSVCPLGEELVSHWTFELGRFAKILGISFNGGYNQANIRDTVPEVR